MKRAGWVKHAAESAFAKILERLVWAAPGSLAAIFVDVDGECVDLAGRGSEFDLKVAAAHWRILLHEASQLPGYEKTRQLIVEAHRQSYLIRPLPEGYALVVILRPRGTVFRVSERALLECEYALLREAGFKAPTHKPWSSVEVLPRGSRRVRPELARGRSDWLSVQVLGVLMGLERGEQGYRVRLGNGAEMTLVREPLGRWWADESID